MFSTDADVLECVGTIQRPHRTGNDTSYRERNLNRSRLADRPGYTGFISGAQDDFGQSFHTITAKASDKFQATTRPGER